LAALSAAASGGLVVLAPAVRAHADPPTVERVYYQRYSSTPFTPCPTPHRYQTDYSCVASDNSESWSRIYSSNADGSDEQSVDIDCTGDNAHTLAPWGAVTKIVVDSANGKLYWENDFEPAIARANLDGSDCEAVSVGPPGYYGKVSLAIDDDGDHLYSVQNSTLRRVDIAAGTVTALTLTGLGITVSDVKDVTVSGDKAYLTLNSVDGHGYIVEVTLDTSTTSQAARVLVDTSPGVVGVSVDADDGYVYWGAISTVQRASLTDGSGQTTVATPPANFVDYVVALPDSGRLLFGYRGDSVAYSSDLDGNDVVATSLRPAAFMSLGRVTGSQAAQTVTWSPGTDLTTAESPITPDPATTDGDGAITYAVVSAGGTGCQVDETSGELAFTDPGDCTVRATAAATSSFLGATADATFHIAAAPVLDLTLDLEQGDAAGGSNVHVTASGLQPSSTVTVELHSDPVVLGTGTADPQGSFSMTVQLPTDIEPGAHVIVASGTSAHGDPVFASQPLLIDWAGAYVDTQTAGAYHAGEPHRVLDTRSEGALAGGETLPVDVSSVVPSGATAIAATFTVTQPAEGGYLTVFPCGTAVPATSTLNFAAGATVANMAITATGTDGKVCAVASTTTHLVVDVNGYFADDGDFLVTQEPTRLVDTRQSTALAAGETLHVTVPDGTDASAAVVNVAAVDPEAEGYLTVFPCGVLPTASNVNFVAGRNAATHAIATLSNGELCVYASAATDVLVDLFGRYAPSGAVMVTVRPERLLDTRATAPLAAGVEHALDLSSLPAPTTAVALNVTVTDAAGDGYLTVHPCGATVPGVSNLDVSANGPAANHVTAALSEDGKVCFVSSVEAQLIVDLGGIYLNAV
jgi:hypothetical protein